MTNTPAEPVTPAEPQEPAQAPTASWDELFKGEDPAKVREALDQSRKWETRAKENNKAAQEAEKARLAAMSESERAIAEAEARGRTAAATEYGKELAQSQFDAAAGRRNPEFDTAKVLRRVDLGTLLDDSGRPDAKAIAEAVADLVPAPESGPPSLDGGARSTAKAEDFNQVLRRAAGRA